MNDIRVYFSRNNYYIDFKVATQNAQSIRILLEPGRELRVGHRSYTHNSRFMRMFLQYLCGLFCQPPLVIRLNRNFNLPTGALFIVLFYPELPTLLDVVGAGEQAERPRAGHRRASRSRATDPAPAIGWPWACVVNVRASLTLAP